MGLFFKSRTEKEAEFMAPQWLKQVNESANLVNTTKKVDVFFSRYDFLIETVNKLIGIEKFLKFKSDKPSEMLKSIESKKVYTINDFIDRYYEDILEQIRKLKTDKAKQKRIDNFYTSFEPYFNQMEKENIDKIHLLNRTLNDKHEIILRNSGSKEIIPQTKEVAIDNMTWTIMISFGESSSKSYEKAVYLAKKAPRYENIIDKHSNNTHAATYTDSKKDFLDFIVLYDLISSWKSTVFAINGEIIDKKTIGKIKYCYGDKCRTVKSDFCFGASYMTANPFGCHRLQISGTNNLQLNLSLTL